MMTNKKRKITRQLNSYALFVIGLLALVVLAGEEDPENPVSPGYFCLVKGVALAVLLGCIGIGKLLGRRGLLPDLKDDEEA